MHLAARDRHRLRRRHAHVEEEVGVVRRARDAPAEAARDRAHVDERRGAAVGVLGIALPGRDPLQHRGHDLVHAQDRVEVALALRERRVDEVALRADAQPERAEVAEHDLALGGLAEDAHVGHAAVAHEVARAGRVAAVLRALRIAVLRLLDLAADGRDHAVAAQLSRRRRRARAAPRRSTRARPSCSRCRARRGCRPRRRPTAGSPARRRARARGPSTRCPCAR